MTRNWLWLTIPILIVVAVVAGCTATATDSKPALSPSQPTVPKSNEPGNGLVQSSSGGAVTIEVKWLGQQNDALVFEVVMDTHSVNLDSYDLKELALLRDDRGKEYLPLSWSSEAGGHHRSGKLAFAVPDQSAKAFELVIRNVAGVKERVLRWRG